MDHVKEIDSLTYFAMLRQGTYALGKEKKTINDLNVFPIPDGDTGDNMHMTMKAGVSASEAAYEAPGVSPAGLAIQA